MAEQVVKKEVKVFNKGGGGAGGMVWFCGFIGALVYNLQQSADFTQGLIGFLKALAWPAFLIYKVYQVLGM